MELNLPVLNQLACCQNLLIAGMGGGFDIFCGLPIYLELERRGQKAHLVNLGFSDIASCTHGDRLTDTLVGWMRCECIRCMRGTFPRDQLLLYRYHE